MTASSSQGKKKSPAGNRMSSKQLARTVLDGRRVTFRCDADIEIVGYLCGMDDFHWMVVTPEGRVSLIHKGRASIITFADEPSFDTEPLRADLDAIVGPFRLYVQKEFFGRDSDTIDRVAS